MAKVVNHGDAAVSDLLECRIGGRIALRKPLEIPAGGSVDVPLSLAVPAVDGPVFAGNSALAGDALACDDKWYFALPVRHPVRSLVVERPAEIGGGMRPSFFLTRALAAGGAGKATAIDADAWAKQSTDGIDSLWFTGGAVDGGARVGEGAGIRRSGRHGGGDGGFATGPAAGRIGRSRRVRKAAAGRADGDAPVGAGSSACSTGFGASRRHFLRCRSGSRGAACPRMASRLLATLAGGFPLLVEAPRGKGRVLWLNASADRTWGDLPLSPAYVALVQQMARARELALQTATTCWVGEAWPDLAKFANRGDLARRAGRRNPATRALRGGVFDAVSEDGKTLWRCAVNVRRAESDLRPVEAAKLQAMLPGKVVAGRQGIREWREEIRREVPLWPWLLAAAALAFLAEGWMSARAAKRREAAAGGALPKWMERRAARMTGSIAVFGVLAVPWCWAHGVDFRGLAERLRTGVARHGWRACAGPRRLLLGLVLLQPQFRRKERVVERPLVGVLIDDSQSMNDGPAPDTRAEVAREWLDSAAFRKARETCDLQVFLDRPRSRGNRAGRAGIQGTESRINAALADWSRRWGARGRGGHGPDFRWPGHRRRTARQRWICPAG